MSNKILEMIDSILELVAPRIKKPGLRNHRNEKERRQEKDHRRTGDYKQWRSRYDKKRERGGHIDRDVSKRAEKSARYRRLHQ